MADTTNLKNIQVDHDLTKTMWPPAQPTGQLGSLVALGLIVALVAVGWWSSRVVETSVRENLHGDLTAMLQSATAALDLWYEGQYRNVKMVSVEPTVRDAVITIVDHKPTGEGSANRLITEIETLQATLEQIGAAYGYSSFAVFNSAGETVATSHQNLLGTQALFKTNDFVERALAGKVCVSTPFRFDLTTGQPAGDNTESLIFVAGPIANNEGQVVAAIALGMPAESEFTRVLDVARTGDSGETYAFDRDALLVSDSRFDQQLRELGLINENQRAILNLRIHDPGGNLLTGHQPTHAPEDWPRTAMAIDALESAEVNNTDIRFDLDGYRDYRGVNVIGAWRWLPEAGIGVTTELDLAEAYRPLYKLRTIFVTLFVLTIVGVLAALAFAHNASSWQRRHSSAHKKLSQLGQYTLEKKIGRGGMGDVYLAQHMLLRRPTAVKLLRRADKDDTAIERFEREVHHTSQLTHPNTIAVYDFGFTPQGVFYYAMEYLDGATCKDVVNIGGPMPEARVINVLTQVCGSLAEAHDHDLIHRDIKPANIMLCDRGGIADFVKVLDFGLVKDTSGDDKQMTQVASFGGTPHFMPPEAVRSARKMDGRSDIYSLGAVAYYLLTGQYVFDEENLMTVCIHHCETAPVVPSQRLGRQIDADLERLVMQCLEKDPTNRPQSAIRLRDDLLKCAAAGQWSQAQAHAWWNNFRDDCREHSLSQRAEPIDAAETIAIDTEQRTVD